MGESGIQHKATRVQPGRAITDAERSRIAALHVQGYSNRAIATLLNREAKAIARALKDERVQALVSAVDQVSPEPGAIEVLRGLLLSQDERVRLAAAQSLLQHKVERVPEPPPPEAEPPEGFKRAVFVPEEPPDLSDDPDD